VGRVEMPARPEPPAPVEGRSDPGPELVAWVAGEPVAARDLLTNLLQRQPRALRAELDRLLAARMAAREARQLGMQLPLELVESRARESWEEVCSAILESGWQGPPEEYVRSAFGLDPDRYRERLRVQALERLQVERAVRSWLLRSERVQARAIVMPDEASLAAAQAALDSGHSFSEVAREHSVDESSERGGRIEPIRREERTPIARLAFQTAVGEVAGPLRLEGESWLLLLVEARPEVLRGEDWGALAAATEASLAQSPVTDEEFWPWRLAMERRYPVDLAPFHALVEEPLP